MKKVWKKWTALLMAVCLAALMMVPTMAAIDSDTSDEVKNGVFQVWVEYEGQKLEGGTCFLINDQYVLTSLHVVQLAQNLESYAEALGFEVDEDDLSIEVYVYRDMSVTATLDATVQSEEADFALLKLNSTVSTKNVLALGDSDTVRASDAVYAFGYPATSLTASAANTSEDVSMKGGIVSKISSEDGISYIEHDADLTSGNSGGPLTDENGSVIGINCFLTDAEEYGAAGADSYYAVAINDVKDGLDVLNIAYTDGGSSSTVSSDDTEADTTTDTTADTTVDTVEEDTVDKTTLDSLITKAEGKTETSYTAASWSTLSTALTSAKSVSESDSATQEEVDSAAETLEKAIDGLEEKSGGLLGLPIWIWIVIAVVALVVIILIIFLILRSSKKKKKKEEEEYYTDYSYNGRGPIDPGTQNQYRNQNQNQNYYGDGSSDTTVLDSGAGETTLLGGGGAYLIRKKNGEKISINTPSFAIGKERRRVSYCISDNSSVSRYHAVINKKGADYYIVDQQSSNFTYVNGVQVSPFAETLLTDRTVIRLSDEEFEFHLS